MFTALQRSGVPSKMLYFPDEAHWGAEAAEFRALVGGGQRLVRSMDALRQVCVGR
jgi:hypothetical protein